MPYSTRIYEDEISTLARYEQLNGYTMLEDVFHAQLENLDPSKQWTISVSINLSSGQTAPVSVQNQIVTLTKTVKSHDFKINPLEPVTINIEATNGTQISIAVQSLDSFYASKRFALLAYLPRQEYQSAVLGKAVLGSFKLASTSKPTNGFILGTSVLGTAALAAEVNLKAWQNIIGPGTSISVSRGVEFNGFTSKADIGTLSFTAYNALIPAVSNLVRGVEIKLIDAAARRPLYTGIIQSSKITPAKDGTYTMKFQCADILSKLSAVNKYQNTREVGATWTQVINELLKDNYYYSISAPKSGRTPLIGSIVKESSLTDYLDIYCATVGASWYANRAGKLVFTDTPEHMPKLCVSDVQNKITSIATVYPVQIDAEHDTSSVISNLEATNNDAIKDETGEWKSITKTARVENQTLKQNYGENKLSIETCAVSTSALTNYLASLLSQYVSSQSVKQAEFTLINDSEEQPELHPLLAIEILDPVLIHYRNTTNLAHVQRISYEITPRKTTCKLDFINHKEKY
ncbi:hypothetical protein RQN30_02285 [Arcanobacterium hippocoleae]